MLIITAIGYSDKAIAVKVNPNVPCCNDDHILHYVP